MTLTLSTGTKFILVTGHDNDKQKAVASYLPGRERAYERQSEPGCPTLTYKCGNNITDNSHKLEVQFSLDVLKWKVSNAWHNRKFMALKLLTELSRSCAMVPASPTTRCITLSTRLRKGSGQSCHTKTKTYTAFKWHTEKVKVALCMPWRHMRERRHGYTHFLVSAPAGGSQFHARLTYSDVNAFGKEAVTSQT